MTNQQIAQEALDRATSGQSLTNYSAIYQGFLERGISDIEPRVNVLTYQAWRAKGRQVCKGEHGVRVLTWIAVPEQKNAAGEVVKGSRRVPHGATVFHISQTKEAEG